MAKTNTFNAAIESKYRWRMIDARVGNTNETKIDVIKSLVRELGYERVLDEMEKGN